MSKELLCIGGMADGKRMTMPGGNRLMIPVVDEKYGGIGQEVYERRTKIENGEKSECLVFVEHRKPAGIRYVKGGPLDGMWFDLYRRFGNNWPPPKAVELFHENYVDGPGHWYVENEAGEFEYRADYKEPSNGNV